MDARPSTVPFERCVRIFDAGNAAPYASRLFEESFGAAFPVPRTECGLPFPTPPENWRQYVALYSWPEGQQETVGFCNWIRVGDVYLEGGMCVSKSIYRRLPPEHFRECRSRGGFAQMIMQEASRTLNDCTAWFGHCGDAKAMAVDLRVGYEPTPVKHLIVKWFRQITDQEKSALIAKIARIGPF